MEWNSRIRGHSPPAPMVFGRLLFTAWVVTFTVVNAAVIITRHLHISSSVVGLSTGILLGCTTYYFVSWSRVWRVVVGALGFVASTTLVIDSTGLFFVFNGVAMWPGAVGTVLVLGVILHSISTNNDSVAAILYFYVGLSCIGIAVVGLTLAWAFQSGVISEGEMALQLLKGLSVSTIGIRIGDNVDSAVPRE